MRENCTSGTGRGGPGNRPSYRRGVLGGDLMTLDPNIGAAIVSAAGGLLQKLLELAGRSSPDTRTERVLSRLYEKAADAVSPYSLRALIVLQDIGSFQLPEQIAEQAQRLASRQEPSGKPFEPDITYRLRYLCL